MKLHGDNNFQRDMLSQTLKKSNLIARNQTYGDFKSNPALGGRKSKKLTTASTLLRKDIALVWLPGK